MTFVFHMILPEMSSGPEPVPPLKAKNPVSPGATRLAVKLSPAHQFKLSILVKVASSCSESMLCSSIIQSEDCISDDTIVA